MMVAQREATFTDGKFTCAYCQSDNVRYAEDMTVEYPIAGIDSELQVMRLDDQNIETSPLTFNERLVCQECGEDSVLPEWVTVEISE